MHISTILHVVSFLAVVLAAAMGVSAGVGWYMGDSPGVVSGMVRAAVATLVVGAVMWGTTRGDHEPMRRDGFAIVSLGWILSSALGSLPFLFTGTIPDVAGALFESVSGFTTTGASVVVDCESFPRGVMFWRCLTQWFGGMGVLILCIAIMPFLKTGAAQIYQAEMTGVSKDRLSPHIITTAKLLWGVYLGHSLLCLVALLGVGMGFFDAVCHTFGLSSTGGLSTRTASIGAYNSPGIEWVCGFMLLTAGMNFTLHIKALRGEPHCYFRDREWRMYMWVWLFLCLFCTLNVWADGSGGLTGAARSAFFNCTAVFTSGGFSIGNFALWPVASRVLLVVAMVCGACAGSTCGGLKLVRVNLSLRHISREIKTFIRPNAVYKIKVGDRIVEDSVVSSVSAFILLWLAILAIGTVAVAFFVPNFETAASSVAACLGNVGPGLDAVGPMGNYAWMHPVAKILLAGCMLLGRLELFTLLVILSRDYWRK